jgi:site-specific DNA-methyltransferase (adenine-specific)
MRYLCRLVTPPGGTVLDPFMGSGSTGKGAILEGFRFIGIDREPDYCAISKARCEHAIGQRDQRQEDSTRQGVLSFTPPPPTKVGTIARCESPSPVPPFPQQPTLPLTVETCET